MFFTMDKSEFTPSGKIINLFFPALGTSVLVLREKKKVETSFIISGGLY